MPNLFDTYGNFADDWGRMRSSRLANPKPNAARSRPDTAAPKPPARVASKPPARVASKQPAPAAEEELFLRFVREELSDDQRLKLLRGLEQWKGLPRSYVGSPDVYGRLVELVRSESAETTRMWLDALI